MKRLHLLEIQEQEWCPSVIRDGVTDFLQHIVQFYHLYRPISQKLVNAFSKSHHDQFVDLCSGAGGPWYSLWNDLLEKMDTGHPKSITLTDLYPNKKAFHNFQKTNPDHFLFCDTPVNMMKVPLEIKGFRTLFSSFHHLKPKEAEELLQKAVDDQCGIAIFESTQRHPLVLLYMLLTPLLVLLNTPFIRPWSWKRIFWTYIIPILPFIVMFDGLVSSLRTYTPDELEKMISKLNAPDYTWEVGLERIKMLPIGVTYLIGYPNR